MYIDVGNLDDHARYAAMTDVIVPRPIAWVLTDNGADAASEHRWNLAPFSFFAGASSDPPQVIFSVGHILGSRPRKDTYANLLERPDCVVHIPSVHHVASVQISARPLEPGDSEVADADLDVVPFDGWSVPRIDGVRIALACRAVRFIPVSEAEKQILVLASVVSIFVDDDVMRTDHRGRSVVDLLALDPAGRAGWGQFVGIRDPFTVPR